MAAGRTYSIVFRELDRILVEGEQKFQLKETMIEDDEIRELATIMEQFEEQQEAPVFTST